MGPHTDAREASSAARRGLRAGLLTVTGALYPAETMRRSLAENVAQAAYDLSAPELAWNLSLAEALLPEIDGGRGVFWMSYALTGQRVHLGQFGGTGPYKVEEFVSRTLNRVSPATFLAQVQTLGAGRAHRILDEDDVSLAQRILGKGADCISVSAPDDAGCGLGLAATHWGALEWSPQRELCLERLAGHIGAGLRLRRSLCDATDTASAAAQGLNGAPSKVAHDNSDDGVEMRFSAEGRCIDALGLGKERSLRDKVREHVLRREKRGAQSEPEGNLWDAVVEGRWSLVDRFESDGKRYVIAYRNPEGILDPRRCTREELDVLLHACRGLSYEETASLTGLQSTTVRTHVRKAVRKLGLKSRVQLPMFYRDATRRSVPLTIHSDLNVTESNDTLGPLSRLLSSAERHVGSLIAAGRSNSEVAATRQTTPRTVANQLAAIFEKLGVHSRLELAAKLMEGSPASLPRKDKDPP